MRKKFRAILHVHKVVFNHLLDENRPIHERVLIGVTIAYFGVIVSKCPVGGVAVHVLFDGIGYFFHTVGALPIVDQFIKWAKN